MISSSSYFMNKHLLILATMPRGHQYIPQNRIHTKQSQNDINFYEKCNSITTPKSLFYIAFRIPGCLC